MAIDSTTLSMMLALDDARVEASRGLLEGLATRVCATEAAAAAPGLRHGFISIEKLFLDAPRPLFGQRAPSVAMNRLTLWSSRAEAGEVVADRALAAWDISDHALSMLLFMSNVYAPQPVTLAAIDGAAESPPDRWTSPAWDLVSGSITPEEEAAVRDGLEALLDARLAAAGVERGGYDLAQDGHGKGLTELLRKARGYDYARTPEAVATIGLQAIWNGVGNPHVLAERQAVRPREMGILVSRISGGFDDLHSAYGASADTVARFTVLTAAVRTIFGNEDIRIVAEFDLRIEDMMLALRDGGLGHKTPCTLRRLFRLPTRDAVRPATPTEAIVATIDADLRAQDRVFANLAEQMATPVKLTGLATRDDRHAALAILDAAQDAYARQRQVAHDAAAAKAEAIEAQVRADVARKLVDLPAALLTAARRAILALAAP